LQSRRRFRQPPPTIVAVPLLQLTTRVRERSFLSLQPELCKTTFIQDGPSFAYGRDGPFQIPGDQSSVHFRVE
jgi:hypothetical protein